MSGRITGGVYITLVVLFIFAPISTLVVFSFQKSKIESVPVQEWSTRWYRMAWNNQDIADGFTNSLLVGSLTMLFSTTLGFMSAHAVVRQGMRNTLRYMAVVSVPVVVPLLLSGIGMLMFFDEIKLGGGFWRIVIAHTCYCSPFALGLIRNSYEQLNIELEQAAWNLGASPFQTMCQIVIPQLWPAIAAAGMLCFLVSWDEFILAWYVGGFTKTLPVVIYGMIGTSFNPSINAVGSVMTGVSIILLCGVFLFGGLSGRTRWVQ